MTRADELRARLLTLRPAFTNRPPAGRSSPTRTGFRRSKVSAAGQFTLPIEARQYWGLTGGDFVEAIETPRAILIRPALDKEGHLAVSIGALPAGVVYGRTLPDGSDRSRRYKLSRVGQLSLPARSRHTWGLDRGGFIEIAFVGSATVVMPIGTSDELAEQWVGDLDIRPLSEHVSDVSKKAHAS